MRFGVLFLMLSTSALFVGQAYSQEGSGCAEALVMATYNRVSTNHLDWRLASYVSQKTYDEIKQSGGANAVIYGVPVGVDYSDYQKRVSEHVDAYSESLTRDQATNIMWTGLDPDASNAYSECLKTKVFSQNGLHLGVKTATKNDVSVVVVWNPVAGEPRVANTQWQWEGAGLAKLPKTLQPGTHIVLLHRPTEQLTLAANYSGYADSLVIDPFPAIPPPPTTHVEHTAETYTSPQVHGWGKNFSPPYTLCTPDKPAGWTVRLVEFHLDGDRRCNEWSICSGSEADSATHLCRTFQIQGYEGGFKGGNAYDTGVMTVIWTHTEPDTPAQ